MIKHNSVSALEIQFPICVAEIKRPRSLAGLTEKEKSILSIYQEIRNELQKTLAKNIHTKYTDSYWLRTREKLVASKRFEYTLTHIAGNSTSPLS